MAGKTLVGIVWIYAALSFVLPLPFGGVAKWVFWLMFLAHVVECVVFREKLRAAPGGFGYNIVQTMLFGVVHVNTLPEPGESAT